MTRMKSHGDAEDFKLICDECKKQRWTKGPCVALLKCMAAMAGIKKVFARCPDCTGVEDWIFQTQKPGKVAITLLPDKT